MNTKRPMLNGRELSEFELAQLRRQLEQMKTIDVVSEEMRALITQYWPHLLAKIKSPKPTPRGH